MKKMLSDFVQEYRVIFDMKKQYDFVHTRSNNVKNAILASALMLLIFGGMGILFHLLENLHYVFLSLNLISVGSFIIYKASKEISFQNYRKTHYSLWIAFGLEVMYLIIVIIGAESIVLLVMYQNAISSIILLFLMGAEIIVSILFFLMSTALESNRYLKGNQKLKLRMTNPSITIIIYAAIHIAIIWLTEIPDAVLEYVTTWILLVVCFYGSSKLERRSGENDSYNIFVILILMTIAVSIISLNDTDSALLIRFSCYIDIAILLMIPLWIPNMERGEVNG
ncbi:MAG: hypothetical protein JXL85_05960 [Bacilli bacterium]|nr:hypothetical protein [Bacilli bacterium]